MVIGNRFTTAAAAAAAQPAILASPTAATSSGDVSQPSDTAQQTKSKRKISLKNIYPKNLKLRIKRGDRNGVLKQLQADQAVVANSKATDSVNTATNKPLDTSASPCNSIENEPMNTDDSKHTDRGMVQLSQEHFSSTGRTQDDEVVDNSENQAASDVADDAVDKTTTASPAGGTAPGSNHSRPKSQTEFSVLDDDTEVDDTKLTEDIV